MENDIILLDTKYIFGQGVVKFINEVEEIWIFQAGTFISERIVYVIRQLILMYK